MEVCTAAAWPVTTTSPTVLGGGVFGGGGLGAAGATDPGWASCAQVAEGASDGVAAAIAMQMSRVRKMASFLDHSRWPRRPHGL
jgi:hypothetical protein